MEGLPEENAPCPTSPSLKSDMSKSLPPDFSSENIQERNVTSDAAELPVGAPQPKMEEYELALPPRIEDWTKEQVRDWLIIRLKVSPNIAENLCKEHLTGACLNSFDKEDLIELGVPRAPAIQIIREVQKLKSHSQTFHPNLWMPKGYNKVGELCKSRETQDISGNVDESVDSVSSDSGIQSLSSANVLLQAARDKIKSVLEPKEPSDMELNTDVTCDETFLHFRRPICEIRPFDKRNHCSFYKINDIFPPVASPSNLLEPIHEYQLLRSPEECSESEILCEFTYEIFRFAASCMNSRTNGTLHFGVSEQSGQGHGQVMGHKITSFSKYNEAFESGLIEYFEEPHINTAKMCIRPPTFIQVYCQDGTTSDKWVIEIDVVPTYAETQENLFYTVSRNASTENKLQCKTLGLFVRDGLRSTNILADPDARVSQEKIKQMTDKIKGLASARKSAEERNEERPSQGHQGQRLKQLITRGRHALENSLKIIVVTDKCHPSTLEHLDFLKEMTLLAVLDFDPQSDVDGLCSFYRRDRVANLHSPWMYATQDSLSAVIDKLNLFKQTSWIFCNGSANEESEKDKPLMLREWLKKRSGDINSLVSFLCNPDFLSSDTLLVVFILHSTVRDISSPVLETFCAIYRTLEGTDNMLCICKDSTVFKCWKDLVESRCKEDISNKCIYELSFSEISSTIKKLKQPQTLSSQRYLPSTGSSSVLLTKKVEDLMPDLDILCENECENTEIETTAAFKEFKIKTEEDFYRGGQVSWWNFYLSEMPGCLPFIKRDKYNELYDLITPVEGHTSPCVIINLFHFPGCGATALAMHVLWNLRRKFRCAVVKNKQTTNTDLAVQVTQLLMTGKHEQSGYTPVLLLVDNWDDVEDLKQRILNVAGDRKRGSNLMVIIVNCERTQFPKDSSRNSHFANVFITNELSTKERNLFSEKLQNLKDYHKKPETFYAFMIMTNNFSEEYIANVVNNNIKNLDTTTQQGRLLSFLALLNTYVNDSYISLSLCEELVGICNPLWKQERLEDKMNPYSMLLITFPVDEHGTYQAVRFLHQMIATNCLKVLTQKHNLSLAEITINLLHCDRLYKSSMGKDFMIQNIQSMLITRQRKEQGDDKDTLFSPLIEAVYEEGPDKMKKVLEKAILRFDKSATLPQALARYYCLKEKDFDSALKWALEAQSKHLNSYMADTVGQVYKSYLKQEIEDSKSLSPEALGNCLRLASLAVEAFQTSQEQAKLDEHPDSFDLHQRKKHKSYNTSGYVGEMEVMLILLDVIKDLPIFSSDRHKRDKMLQFLKGHCSVKCFRDIHDTFSNQLVAVLEDHERFLVSFKHRLKEIFVFFENYFTYLRPRSQERELVDERHKRRVSDYFKKYIEMFITSEVEKTSEKVSKPKLSLNQEIMDNRCYLEMRQADSFAGLLQCLSDKSEVEMERIVKKWQFIFNNSANRHVSDTVNFILAQIVLHSIKPTSKLLKKYDELLHLLNEALQKEGTQSNSTELYYLSMLLMWPTKDQSLENLSKYKNISTNITSAKKSFHRRFSHMFPARRAITHFYLGKSNGLKRIVSKVTLDKILFDLVKQQADCSDQSSHPSKPHHLWQSGAAWNKPEVQNKLLRIKGTSENGDIYVIYGANLKLQLRPAYLGDIRSGYSREAVSFYVGFTMEGPVAYDIKYENVC
ncbi:sterile alpha motif domain-containing protein 9 [Thalassophryne amazonica]|uniref:sterile alpha motif domain-containing protein 9 n=1 Tax=Thalassophryne amazonica TaxID=390379 RepID=UPI0014717726|nr:sterile alpha motif domain-containing protein 9 [Thalassophryne amazonica]